MKKKTLARHKMTDLYYGGRHLDFWFLADNESGVPLHEISGFALISRITGRHKTIATSKTYVQQLKLFWEDVILWNSLDWREVTEEDLTHYLFEHRFKQQKLSGKSIQLQLTAISEFYKWAYKFGLIEYPKEFEIGFDYPELYYEMAYAKKDKLIQSQYIPRNEFEDLLEGGGSS